MDDLRFGSTIRSVRIRKRLTQEDVSKLAGVSRGTVSRIERGHLDEVSLGSIRAVAKALDVRVDLVPRWRGGDLDRLLNSRHSALHEQVARTFAERPEWLTAPEVSFAIYTERGVIDILAWHARRQMLLMIELKTDIVDVNELLGTLDRKRRLAWQVARDRGWDVGERTSTSAWVIVAESHTNRRRVQAHGAMLRAALPLDGRSIAGWLRDPSRPVGALSFWPDARPMSVSGGRAPVRRVRSVARPRS
ncbi:MAG TPA: helix-turn-helix transcriptional regulator [Methylomirabilota bacterium]|nr:helix-turn-helix transcriptional regulator [Methylomirabilota bacterium]